MHLATYLGLLETGSHTLSSSYHHVTQGHPRELDVVAICSQFAEQCDQHRRALTPLTTRYGVHAAGEPERLHAQGMEDSRSGGLGLVRDLHDLYLLATYLDMAWTVVGQAGKGARDHEVLDVVDQSAHEISGQLAWLDTRLKAAAPQALLVAD